MTSVHEWETLSVSNKISFIDFKEAWPHTLRPIGASSTTGGTYQTCGQRI